jgi:hypothetical protein
MFKHPYESDSSYSRYSLFLITKFFYVAFYYFHQKVELLLNLMHQDTVGPLSCQLEELKAIHPVPGSFIAPIPHRCGQLLPLSWLPFQLLPRWEQIKFAIVDVEMFLYNCLTICSSEKNTQSHTCVCTNDLDLFISEFGKQWTVMCQES